MKTTMHISIKPQSRYLQGFYFTPSIMLLWRKRKFIVVFGFLAFYIELEFNEERGLQW